MLVYQRVESIRIHENPWESIIDTIDHAWKSWCFPGSDGLWFFWNRLHHVFQIFIPCWFIDGKNGGYVPKHRTPLMMLMPVDAMSWGVTHVTPHNPHITTLLSTFIHLSYGYGSKPWYLVNPKIAGKWMFIPLKMVLIGIDPYPYLEDYHDPFWRWPDQAQKKRWLGTGLVLECNM